MSAKKYNEGDRFGSLVIAERRGVVRGSSRVVVQCDCGGVREFSLTNLVTGATIHCGSRDHHPDPRSKGDEVTYGTAHKRLALALGSAKLHACVSCGEPARDWAYSHADPDQRRQPDGKDAGRMYSTRFDHYRPMCRPCHVRDERAHERLSGGGLSLIHHAYWLARS